MKLISIILLCIISSSTLAQYDNVTDEACSNLNEYTALPEADVAELEEVVTDYLKEALKDSPEIVKGIDEMPKGALQQSLLIRFAECYLQGKYVKKDPER